MSDQDTDLNPSESAPSEDALMKISASFLHMNKFLAKTSKTLSNPPTYDHFTRQKCNHVYYCSRPRSDPRWKIPVPSNEAGGRSCSPAFSRLALLLCAFDPQSLLAWAGPVSGMHYIV